MKLEFNLTNKYSKLADGTDYIHSLCNGWKSDVTFSRRPRLTRICTLLTSWKPVRIESGYNVQDLPESDNATSFHQDNAYQNWHTSTGNVVTARIALSETRANSGGIEYLLGSHQMSDIKRLNGSFIVSGEIPTKNWIRGLGRVGLRIINCFGQSLNAGDVVFHHGLLWHGSCPNF